MPIAPDNFNERHAITVIDSYYKEGYCTIPALATFLRNEYRDISLKQAVQTVNKWIDEYKIKHEHLAVVYSKSNKREVIVKQSSLDRIRNNSKESKSK